MTTTLAKDCKHFNSPCSSLFIPSCSNEISIFVFMVLVVRSERSMLMQYVRLRIHVASHQWQLDSYNIGLCPDRQSSWRLSSPSDIVQCPTGHRTMPGQTPLKLYTLNLTIIHAAGQAPYVRRRIVRYLVK